MKQLNSIFYNCKQATFLIEKQQNKNLTLRERLFLFIHLFGCDVCKIYKKQSIAISKMVQKLLREASAKPPVLDEEFKRSLQLKIDEAIRKN